MRTFSGKRSALALAIAGVTALSGIVIVPQAAAAGFVDDSTLTGGVYYWQRERDRKDLNEFKTEKKPNGEKVTVNNPDYNK